MLLEEINFRHILDFVTHVTLLANSPPLVHFLLIIFFLSQVSEYASVLCLLETWPTMTQSGNLKTLDLTTSNEDDASCTFDGSS